MERNPNDAPIAVDADGPADVPRLEPGETQRGTFGGEPGEWEGTDDPARPVWHADSGGTVQIDSSE